MATHPDDTAQGPENGPPPDGKRHIFDNPKNVWRVIYALHVICAISIAAEFSIQRHLYHSWESLFGFYGIYGFVACVILVLIAKEMRRILMRGEDYYEGRDE